MSGNLLVWLDDLVGERPVPSGIAKVVEVLRADPKATAFATVRSMAENAKVNIATVTRTGQFLGYSGWPAFVLDYRGHYLATLRAGSLISHDDDPDVLFGARGSVLQDAHALQDMAGVIEEQAVQRAADRLRATRRTVVLASGVAMSPALLFSHGCQLLGFDSELPMVAASTQLNAVRKLGPEDTLVIFTLWKTADIVFRLTRYAHSLGVPILAFEDRSTSVSHLADFSLRVPTQGTRYLPSVVPAMSAVQAVVGQLADAEPERMRAQLEEIDELWAELGIIDND